MTPPFLGQALVPSIIEILANLGVLLSLTLAVYRYHMLDRHTEIQKMPVFPLELIDGAIPIFDRYVAGMRTRIKMRPSLQPELLLKISHCTRASAILDLARQAPARERDEWPEATSNLFGSFKPWSFPEARCEAHIGWAGIRDDALVEEFGPCVEPSEEGARYPFLCESVSDAMR